MKRLTVLSTLLFLFLLSRAQQFKVSYSDELKYEQTANTMTQFPNGFIACEVLYDKSQLGRVITLKNFKLGIRLTKYDLSRNPQNQYTLSNGDRLYGPMYPSLFILKGQPYLVYFQLVPEEEKMRIMLAKIDTATMETGQPKELIVVAQDDHERFKSMKFMTSQKFVLSTSPDSSKLLAVWNSGIDKDNDYFLGVYDRSLDKAWNKKETISYTSSPPVFQSACTDNEGNVILGYKVDGDRKSYDGRITLIRPGIKSIDRDIRITDGHAATIMLLPAKNGSHVTIAGTYSDKPPYVSGVYTQQLSIQNGKMGTLKQTAFPDDLTEQIHRDGWAETKKNSYGLHPIALQPFQEEDGSIDMLGAFNSNDWIGSMQHSVRVSITGDILYIHIGITGAPIFSRLPKYRRSAENTIGESYYAFLFNNQLVVLYNDSESNLSQDINATPSSSDRYNNLVLVAATFPGNGQPKREKIIDLAKESYLSVTEDIHALSPSSLRIPLRKIKGLGGLSDKFKWAELEIK